MNEDQRDADQQRAAADRVDGTIKRYLAIGAAVIGALNGVLLSQSDVVIPPWFRLTLVATNAILVAVALVIDPNASHGSG